ncbi:MAG: HypC/HybG/HupF family hydrogenase formation chaperone [Coriobacteriia bacterium]|nr:HypC/HybG/HupF family hydrogenase formation chaperone [Coriobacteriia bacterium]
MCLAIPARVIAINADRTALIDVSGVQRQVAIDLVPHVQVDDYVLVHAGFAIEVMSAEEAQETMELLQQFPELAEGAF